MNFLGDMGISPKLINQLTLDGYDAVHIAAKGLAKASDQSIIEIARKENRILLTR